MSIQPLTKPELGSFRDGLRHRRAVRRQDAEKAARQAEREAARAWELRKADVYKRDQGRCRAFNVSLRLKARHEGDLTAMHPHHVIFRSQGGTDDLENIATLSPVAHDLIHGLHAKRLHCSGNANETLTFWFTDAETGKVLSTWESPCPRPSVTVGGGE